MNDAERTIPPGSVETFVDAAGGRMRVLRGAGEGTSTPILLVHGGGSDNAGISWYRLIEPLSAARAVVAPDLAGFGGTEGVPVTGTASGMADHLAELLDVLDIERAIVCGVSMGGEVAVHFALRHPDRCVALVAVAPGGFIERFRSAALHRVVWWSTLIPDRLLAPMAAFANRFTRSLVKKMVRDPKTLPPEVIDEISREARRPGSGMAYGEYNKKAIGPAGMRNYLLPAIGSLTLPILFFHGADDPLVPPEGSRAAAAAIPGARLVLVPDCGHWAQLEAHDRFLEELERLLDEARPGAGPHAQPTDLA